MDKPYPLAQNAMADLRAAIWLLLETAPSEGLKNSHIGRTLGIYSGHVGHEGHISRTILALMQAEGVVEQDTTSKCWRLRRQQDQDSVE